VQRFLAGLVPGAMLLGAAWLLQWHAVTRAALAPSAPFFCFGALAAAVFLSWYYDQSRPLYAAALIAVSVVALDQLPPDWSARRITIAIFLPLNFAFFAALRERGVASLDGLVLAGVVVAQVVAMPWVPAGAAVPAGLGPGSSELPDPGLGMPGLAQVSFAAGATALLVVIARRHGKVEHGMFWAFSAMFLGLTRQTETALWFYAGIGGLALAYGVLEYGRDMVHRDELTGLPGRRAFNSVIERTGRPYTIAICDIDHFKRVNDMYGHDAGDQVLRMVAAKLHYVGGGGRTFRYGGEEFVILFRGRGAAEALPFAEAVRKAVADAGFTPRHPNRPVTRPAQGPLPAYALAARVTITISIGLAEAPPHSTADVVLDEADEAMYRAKQAGRNCVKVAGAV
jgi:GGDEF domain-containing protein